MIWITIAWTHGLGQHFASLTPVQQQATLKWTTALVEPFAIMTCMWGRISFSVFLLYIIGPSDIRQKWTLWSIIAIQLIANWVTIIQLYAQCGSHVTALWDYAVAAAPATHCQSLNVQTIIGYVQSGLNSLCDLVLTFLPVKILWSLNMPLAQKIVLGSMLTLSIFAFGASLAKAVQIRNISVSGDFSYAMVGLMIWACIENNVVMIMATIPTLRPLIRKRGAGYGYGSTPKPYSDSRSAPRSAPVNKDPYSVEHDIHRSGRGISDGNSEEYILQPMPEGGERFTKTMD